MKRFLSTTVLSLLMATTGMTLTACDDDEVAAGVAGAVIGAGVATIVNNNHNDNDCRRGGRRDVCSNYYDYNGNLRRDCRQVDRRCRRTESTEAFNDNLLTELASGSRIQVRQHAAANGLAVEDFASEYKLSFDRAERFWSALDASDQGDAAPLRTLGLSSEDVQLLGQYKLPTPTGIDAVARSLDQRSDLTTAMFNRIRAWSLSEKTRICAKPTDTMNGDERALCNVR